MYLNNKLFTNVEFYYYRSTFRKQLNETIVSSKNITNLIGHGVSTSCTQSLLSGISEFNERVPLFEKKGPNLIGIRLTTKEVVAVDSSKVYFGNSEYGDSSGVASFSDSKHALKKALLEFYERQSFIFHWINQESGKSLEKSDLGSSLITSTYYKMMEKTFNEISIAEISIFKGVHVIFIMGISSKMKAVGLGSSDNLQSAIANALREACEGLAGRDPLKISWNKNIAIFDKNSNEEAYLKLSPQKLKRIYAFLFKVSPKIPVVNKRTNTTDFWECLSINENMHHIHIIAVAIMTKDPRIKEFKIITSFGGYSHMYPPKIPEQERDSYLIDKALNKQCFDPIPFP
ncbi:YcaO-like family protein [Lactobacillus sp. DCY120]|uniref:YcaO-like family protein n=1 Tax=Bombilactobacillus apium TaxID=2675299 RepID=A0A850R1I0_9LACO|nr:YcaO-like family protein [Bombilactobacillus apium]NVY96783.1 YcaO-like family protein [Bombilactobacillus apium]